MTLSSVFETLATGKYGCTEVRVYPAECGEQIGRDPSKIGSSKSLVLKSFSWERDTLGLVPASLPHTLGHALLFTPPLPLPQSNHTLRKHLQANVSEHKIALRKAS